MSQLKEPCPQAAAGSSAGKAQQCGSGPRGSMPARKPFEPKAQVPEQRPERAHVGADWGTLNPATPAGAR